MSPVRLGLIWYFNFLSRSLFKILYNVKDAVAYAGTQIIKMDTPSLSFNFRWPLHVQGPSRPHGYNPDASTIVRIIVIPKYAEAFQLSNSHLGDIGEKIVWDSLDFLQSARFYAPDGVKITKEYDIPFRARNMEVLQDLLQHQFYLSIGICHGQRKILFDRNRLRASVNRCG